MMDAPFAKPVSTSIEYPPTDDAKPEMSYGNKAVVLRMNPFFTHLEIRCLQNRVSPEKPPIFSGTEILATFESNCSDEPEGKLKFSRLR